jgi:4-methylaminobutanoate oxidase (formaldehyde-forming)
MQPRGWAGMGWSPAIVAEHRGTRAAAGLFDESSFAKIEVSGPGAAELLSWLCDNDIDREVGTVTYTQALNSRGGIECDFTVARLEEQLFRIVTGTAYGSRDLTWLRRHASDDGSVRITDVTGQYTCFALWGPNSRKILEQLTPAGLDNESFPYMTARQITVGDVPLTAQRVTFVGELGWELYCPTEYGAGLWRAVYEEGRSHGLLAGGYRAIDSLRLEKGYRVWAADITPDETPYEAGLDFCVRKANRDFIGAEALDPQPPKRLRCIVLDEPHSVALGNEPVQIDGRISGRVTSGGYGYTVQRSIAYAYLPTEVAYGEAVEIDIFGRWVEGEVVSEPLFDPGGERVRSAVSPARSG